MAHGKMDGEMEALTHALELRRLEAVYVARTIKAFYQFSPHKLKFCK